MLTFAALVAGPQGPAAGAVPETLSPPRRTQPCVAAVGLRRCPNNAEIGPEGRSWYCRDHAWKYDLI